MARKDKVMQVFGRLEKTSYFCRVKNETESFVILIGGQNHRMPDKMTG
jgi:hypothetical protein